MRKNYITPIIAAISANGVNLLSTSCEIEVKNQDYNEETMTDLSRPHYNVWDEEEE